MAAGYSGVGTVNIGGGSVAAALAAPATTQTCKYSFTTFTGGTGDRTLYTVTGGKTFYCTGIFVYIGSLSTLIFKNTAGTTIFSCQSPTGMYFIDLGSAPFSATDTIKMLSADQPGGTNYYTVIGFEQ
jgi:hypothetical protein